MSSDDEAMDMLAFFKLLGRLKHLPRAGWLRFPINPVESVASHMYRMAVMSFFFDDKLNKSGGSSLNQMRCMKMALVHDMAESIVGDITPHCGISGEDKHKRENDAMKHIRTLVPKSVGEEFYQLWMEYEAQETAEAKAVKDLDKFDMIMQAYEYETENANGTKKHLQEFFKSSEGKLDSDLVKEWARKLHEQRNQDDEKK